MNPKSSAPHARRSSTILIAPCLCVGQTQACEPPAFEFPKYFRDADRNGDGFLQLVELLAAPGGSQGDGYGTSLDKPPNTQAAFFGLDQDRDARLSPDELWQWGTYTHNSCARLYAAQDTERDARDWPQSLLAWFTALFR